jgi:general secretion pathway protein C
MIPERKKLITFGISTLSGVVAGTVALIVINASFLKVPGPPPASVVSASRAETEQPAPVEPDYTAIAQRNLFRAKLEVEIPKPKSPHEIEEETLTAIVKTMMLKGVMLGHHGRDNFAVIDRGGQKGVWTYETGEVIEKGLALKEIKKDSVRIEKGDFGVVLRLFSSTFERTPGQTAGVAAPAARTSARTDAGKDIKKQGAITRISKSLAEKLKANSNMIMSSIAVKPASDGVKVVSVDKGSIAQQMGIAPDDTLQEVNGHRLNSTEDMGKVYDALKNATDFEVKLLRRGKSETLRYEIQ